MTTDDGQMGGNQFKAQQWPSNERNQHVDGLLAERRMLDHIASSRQEEKQRCMRLLSHSLSLSIQRCASFSCYFSSVQKFINSSSCSCTLHNVTNVSSYTFKYFFGSSCFRKVRIHPLFAYPKNPIFVFKSNNILSSLLLFPPPSFGSVFCELLRYQNATKW